MAQENILIVEDEDVVAKHFWLALEMWEYTPFLAKTGAEAIQLAGEIRPDLILMDIHLDGDMDGVEAAGQIRSRFDIPIVYLTAYSDDDLLQQAKITGPYGYLVKPIQDRELHSTIEVTLHKHRLDRQYHEHLEKAVKERTVELKHANDELKRAYQELKNTQVQLVQTAKLASIGELAAGIAHELSQPVMVIRSNAQFLQRTFEEGKLKAEQLMKLLEPIERQTKRMMHIINHLRTFARHAPLEYVPVNLNQVIEDASLVIHEHLRSHEILMSKTLATELPPVLGDAIQLEQVVLNLIANARDAIDAKKGNAPGRIDLVTRISEGEGDVVELLLKDNGTGIAPEHLRKIFDPFFTTREVAKGIGLGLSISYGIIKEHQGEIGVMETSPEGTTFKVTLPVVIED